MARGGRLVPEARIERRQIRPGDAKVLTTPGGKSVYTSRRSTTMRDAAALTASNTVQRLMGFWLCWHAFGGDHPMREAGWPASTIRQARREFLDLYGVDVDAWRPSTDEAARLLKVLGIDVEALAAMLPALGTQLPLAAG